MARSRKPTLIWGDKRRAMTAAGRAALNAVVNQQAQIIAYIDDYKLFLIAALAISPLLVVFKKPPRAAGEHEMMTE